MQLKTNLYRWETITWKERYFHIRSMRGHPNHPNGTRGSFTALSSAKGSGNPFKIFYLQMIATIYFKRDSIYWQDIATSIFELFYFKFYFELLLDLRHRSLLCWESFESSDNAFCLLKLEYPDVPHPSWNTRSYILDFDDFGSNQTWSDLEGRG